MSVASLVRIVKFAVYTYMYTIGLTACNYHICIKLCTCVFNLIGECYSDTAPGELGKGKDGLVVCAQC